MKRQTKAVKNVGVWRLNLVRLMFIALVLALGWRLADIQILNTDFLRNQGDARHVRKVPVAAHRGMILDRHGEPLAISTPVHSVWLNPQEVAIDHVDLNQLAQILNIRLGVIQKKDKNK